jgi:hypothetical protein
MRCTICNHCLTDYEATMRHKDTGEFLDLCSPCRKSVMSMASFEVTDRPDLLVEFDIDLEDSWGLWRHGRRTPV